MLALYHWFNTMLYHLFFQMFYSFLQFFVVSLQLGMIGAQNAEFLWERCKFNCWLIFVIRNLISIIIFEKTILATLQLWSLFLLFDAVLSLNELEKILAALFEIWVWVWFWSPGWAFEIKLIKLTYETWNILMFEILWHCLSDKFWHVVNYECISIFIPGNDPAISLLVKNIRKFGNKLLLPHHIGIITNL